MKLERRQIAELVAFVGVVCGVVALFLDWFPQNKYSSDGTFLVAELVLLALAAGCLEGSLLFGKAELDLVAAVAGAGAFGLYLFMPALFAFNHFGDLRAGAWLGVCAGLIPLGAGTARLCYGRSNAKAPGVNPWLAGALAGLVSIVIGIWSTVERGLPSYWKFSISTAFGSAKTEHALGLLLLVLAIVSALLIAVAAATRKAELADLALIVSAVLAGVATFDGVRVAFGDFGVLRNGGWLELVGGLVLVLSLIGQRVVKLPELELPVSKTTTKKK